MLTRVGSRNSHQGEHTPAEAAEFLNQVMGLDLSAENIAALEACTEGKRWDQGWFD